LAHANRACCVNGNTTDQGIGVFNSMTEFGGDLVQYRYRLFYYLGAYADYQNAIVESVETNNPKTASKTIAVK